MLLLRKSCYSYNQLTEGFVSEEKRMMACAPFRAFCETALIGKIYHNPETAAANTSSSHDFHTFMSGIGGHSPKGGKKIHDDSHDCQVTPPSYVFQ